MAAFEAAARYRWVILGIALASQAGSAVVGQVLAPLAPLFQPELGLSKGEVGLLASATYVGAWSVCLISGSLVDRFGVRRTTSLSLLLTGCLMLAMSAVGSPVQAAALMFLAGMIRGPVGPGSTKAVLDWFPPSARATMMGFKQIGMPAAGAVTASTLPALGLLLGWRSAIGVVGFFTIATGVLAAALYRDHRHPSHPTGRIGSMRAGLGTLARNRRLWTASTLCLLFVAVQMASLTYMALYFKDVVLVDLVPDESDRIVAAGGYLALCQAGGVFGRVFWGAVSDRFFQGRRAMVMVIIGAMTTTISIVVAHLGTNHPTWLLTVIVLAFGASAIAWNGAYLALIGDMVDSKHAATAVGFSMTLSEAGTVGGPPLFGFVVDMTGSYRVAWLLLSCLGAAGTLVAILAARGERRPSA